MASRKKVTLIDIAQAAGVSKSTVSLILLNKPGVGLQTRQRVLELARKMGYDTRMRPRLAATDEDRRDVVFLIEERYFITAEYFYSRIYQGIKEILEPEGFHPNFTTLSDDQRQRLELPPIMSKPTLAGVLVGGELSEAYCRLLRETRLPVVLIGCDPVDQPWGRVVNDNLTGAQTAVEHLIGLGHRRIACLASRVGHDNIAERINGYKLAMLNHLGSVDSTLLIAQEGPTSIEQGYALTQQLLREQSDFTAIFATTDTIAIGALNALSEAGLRVPERVSLVGFDNIEWSRHTNPPMTTIDIDRRLMGNIAADNLVSQMLLGREGPHALSRTVIPVGLLERASTALLAAQTPSRSEKTSAVFATNASQPRR